MSQPISNNICNRITLSDGRKLGFVEFGDLKGKPVFYFHGFPGSRLEAKLAERISRDSHVRFIGIDRPGFGLSEFKPDRRLMDWPDAPGSDFPSLSRTADSWTGRISTKT
jgi:pimeloyl-ACP methyl ester carboxylesterase